MTALSNAAEKVSLIGAIALFMVDKTDPAYFLLGTGGYGMVRGGAARPPSNQTKD